MGDYYALLGLTPAASEREIREAFRQLAKRLHPDVSRLPSGAERFRRIVEAYETLSDPARRAAYDARYRATAAAPQTTVAPAPVQRPVQRPGLRPATGARRPAGPAPPTGAGSAARPRGPVTPVAPVGAVGALSRGERARRAAEAIRAAAVGVRCVECGTLVSGDADRCPACLRKYGTFQDHLARALRAKRRA